MLFRRQNVELWEICRGCGSSLRETSREIARSQWRSMVFRLLHTSACRSEVVHDEDVVFFVVLCCVVLKVTYRNWGIARQFSCWNCSNSVNTCKISGFHGGHYEECRLLGYNTPVRTSQETHYVSVAESSRLMLCKIWGFTAMTM
jgi:hypothetical protein